jgi:hypothetical protein
VKRFFPTTLSSAGRRAILPETRNGICILCAGAYKNVGQRKEFHRERLPPEIQLGDDMTGKAPEGSRFSLLYRPRGDRSSVMSERVRRRLLGVLFGRLIGHEERSSFAQEIERRVGIEVPNNNLEFIFLKSARDDFLDVLTVAYDDFLQRDSRYAERWLTTVRLVFEEEHVAYRIDNKGGVHPFVDSAFEGQRIAAIEVLAGVRYSATLAKFEEAHEALRARNRVLAIRHIFEAIENLFRLLPGRGSTLSGNSLREKLRPLIAKLYDAYPAAQRAANNLMESLAEWVNGAHNFRHAQGDD